MTWPWNLAGDLDSFWMLVGFLDRQGRPKCWGRSVAREGRNREDGRERERGEDRSLRMWGIFGVEGVEPSRRG